MDETKKKSVREEITLVEPTENAFQQTRVATSMDLALAPLYFEPCDSQNAIEILNFLFKSNESSLWYHDDVVPCDIFTYSPYVYFEYCDYRKPATQS